MDWTTNSINGENNRQIIIKWKELLVAALLYAYLLDRLSNSNWKTVIRVMISYKQNVKLWNLFEVFAKSFCVCVCVCLWC